MTLLPTRSCRPRRRPSSLTFTEPLETSYSRAELFDQTGAAVPGATSTIGPDPRSMSVTIPAGLANGTYSLLWRTLSTVDGHTAQGYLPFTIGTDADVRIATQPADATTAGALPEWSVVSCPLVGVAWAGGRGRHLADLALRRAAGDLARLAARTKTDSPRRAATRSARSSSR